MARATARDRAWAALAAVAGAFTVLNGAACLYSALGGNWAVVLRAPFGVLFGYWVAVGAWRRTRWGRPAVAYEGGGGANHAGAMILLSAGAVVALSLAVGVQALLGRS